VRPRDGLLTAKSVNGLELLFGRWGVSIPAGFLVGRFGWQRAWVKVAMSGKTNP